jgi:hypothetical protein
MNTYLLIYIDGEHITYREYGKSIYNSIIIGLEKNESCYGIE